MGGLVPPPPPQRKHEIWVSNREWALFWARVYNTVRDSCDVMKKALSSPLLYGSCVDPVSNHVDEQGVTRYRSNNQSLPALYTPTLMARCHPTLYTRTVETVKRRCLSHVPVREFLSLSLFPCAATIFNVIHFCCCKTGCQSLWML